MAYDLGKPELDEKVRELVAATSSHENQELIAELVTTVLKLHRDGASRADLRLMNTALKEMRYSNLVFSRHREPKVTIYGSARITEQDPNYRIAEDFAVQDRDQGMGRDHRGGAGDHGGGHPRCRHRELVRGEHPTPVRSSGQSLPGRVAHRQLQVLLHPKTGLRQGVARLRHPPRRLGDPGRGIRAAHPDPDRQERPAPDRPPRGSGDQLLGPDDRFHQGAPIAAWADLSNRPRPLPPHHRPSRGLRPHLGLLRQLSLPALRRRSADPSSRPGPRRRPARRS